MRVGFLLSPFVVVAVSSCFFDPPDYSGASCPCPDGYACVAGTCAPGGGGAGGGNPIESCTQYGQLQVGVRWVTPEMAAVVLDDYDFPAFDGFELLVGEGTLDGPGPPDDPSTYRRITPTERPELGVTDVRPDQPNLVLVDGLTPGKDHWVIGAIRTRDPLRPCSLTAATVFTTPAVPPGEQIIFAETIVGTGYTVPATFQPRSGELRYDATCASLPRLPDCSSCCYENVIVGFPSGIPLASTLGSTPEGLGRAYFEAEIAFEPAPASSPLVQSQRFYAVVEDGAASFLFRLEPAYRFTLPTGATRRKVQIPFSLLDKVLDPSMRIGPLTQADATGVGRLTSVVVGGDWVDGTVMRMDNVKIRF